MHAIYYFLTELDRNLDEGSIWTQAEDRIIDYSVAHCDENNWWALESVVLDDDQWAVGDGMLEHNAGYWKQAWIEATWAVAFDFKWYLPMDYTRGALPGLNADLDTPRQAIVDMIGAEVPAYLAWSYGQMVAPQPSVEDPLDRYRRSSIATAYEMFLATNGPDRYPFTDTIRPPYDYRAFDLSGDQSANAIICVDIHT